MATTYNQTATGVAVYERQVKTLYNRIDMSSVASGAAALGDIIQLFSIPAETFVLDVRYRLKTAEGAACTVDIGDGGSATRFFSNADMNVAVDTSAISTTRTYYYGTADTIDMTLDHASTDTFVLDVFVDIMPLAD